MTAHGHLTRRRNCVRRCACLHPRVLFNTALVRLYPYAPNSFLLFFFWSKENDVAFLASVPNFSCYKSLFFLFYKMGYACHEINFDNSMDLVLDVHIFTAFSYFNKCNICCCKSLGILFWRRPVFTPHYKA